MGHHELGVGGHVVEQVWLDNFAGTDRYDIGTRGLVVLMSVSEL